jgi:iron complex outermembrane receptor protein
MKKTYAPIARLALCAIFISPLGFMSSLAQAQTETPIEADTIVITASRGAPQKAKNTLATIDVILADVIQAGQLQVNVSDTLSRVPGIVAQNRQNYAQDI